MIPLASIAARTLGKRIGKVTTKQMQVAGILNSYLIEVFKNHKLIKIFQKENFEKNRAEEKINDFKETQKNKRNLCENFPYNGMFNGNNDCIFNFYFSQIN